MCPDEEPTDQDVAEAERELIRFFNSTIFLDAWRPDCPICRAKRSHLPLWIRALTFLLPVLALIAFFLFALSHFQHSNEVWIILLPVCLGSGAQSCFFLGRWLEARWQRRAHAMLDANDRLDVRLTRVVVLMAQEGHHIVLFEQGAVFDTMRRTEDLIQDIQAYRYLLREKDHGNGSDARHSEALSAISRLREHKRGLHEYARAMTEYLKACLKTAGELHIGSLSLRTGQRPKPADHRVAVDLAVDLFYALQDILRGTVRAVRHKNPARAMAKCLRSDKPDFAAVDKVLQDYLDALPKIPAAPQLPSSAQ